MDIILVRHGEAVEFSYGCDDFKRQLTERGKRDIKKVIQQTANHIKKEHKILIWASPAVRANETAQIIADELKLENIDYYKFILDGDYELLAKQIEQVDDDSTVFIVGHQPYLSIWSRKIASIKVPFRKGTMAGFNITSKNPIKANMEWIECAIMDSEENKPSLDNVITKKDLKEIMIGILNDIEDLQNQYLNDSDNIEIVHKIRVKIRQLRSLISFIKQIFYEEEYKDYQKKLSEIAKKFSYIREIDVLTGQWYSILSKNKDLLKDFSLTKVLKDEREKEKLKINDYIISKTMNSELDNILSWIKTWEESPEEDLKISQLAINKFNKWNSAVTKGIKNIKFNKLKEVHSLRILYKKVRYVQNSIEYFNKNSKWNLAQLKDKQDDLGYYCDIVNNIAILKDLNSKYNMKNLQFETGVFIGYQLYFKEMIINKLS